MLLESFVTVDFDVLLIWILEYDEFIFIVYDPFDEGICNLFTYLFIYVNFPKVLCFYALW